MKYWGRVTKPTIRPQVSLSHLHNTRVAISIAYYSWNHANTAVTFESADVNEILFSNSFTNHQEWAKEIISMTWIPGLLSEIRNYVTNLVSYTVKPNFSANKVGFNFVDSKISNYISNFATWFQLVIHNVIYILTQELLCQKLCEILCNIECGDFISLFPLFDGLFEKVYYYWFHQDTNTSNFIQTAQLCTLFSALSLVLIPASSVWYIAFQTICQRVLMILGKAIWHSNIVVDSAWASCHNSPIFCYSAKCQTWQQTYLAFFWFHLVEHSHTSNVHV